MFQSTTFALPKVFDERLGGIALSATALGQLAFVVFALASIGQLIVGHFLDRLGPRTVFIAAAAMQVVFFALMPGLSDWAALACAMAFMLAAFGQIPINDYMIGRMAEGEWRARIYGVRYVVSFTALAAALPLIAFIYESWGFDALFRVLAVSAAIILAAVLHAAAASAGAGSARRPVREPAPGQRDGTIVAAKAAMASAAAARLPLRVKPELPRGPRSWSPSLAQCTRIAR